MSANARFPLRAALLGLALFSALPLFARNEARKLVGTYKGETRTQEETRAQSRESTYAIRHHTIEVSLGPDGSATVTQSPDAVSETTSFAHWKYADGRLTLTFDPTTPNTSAAAPMIFEVKGADLIPIAWDHALWPHLPPPHLHRE